jgi:hypothetical protein
VSEWVSEQIWHSGQEVSVNKDGSVCLTFPVADFREVRREILRHGADVELLSPPESREEVIKEIEEMGKVYRWDIFWGRGSNRTSPTELILDEESSGEGKENK